MKVFHLRVMLGQDDCGGGGVGGRFTTFWSHTI